MIPFPIKKTSFTELMFDLLEVHMGSITKIIKFYQFRPQPCLSNNGITSKSTIDLLKTIFSTNGSYNVTYDKEKYTIDILDIEDNYIFGKCAKENELRIGNFLQTRNKHTNETEPYSSVSPDTQLEVYTFFLIDGLNNRMSAIQHKSITKLGQILSEGIWQLSSNTLEFFIAPERIKNIKKTAKKITKNKKLSVSFAPNSISKYNIDSLASELGGIKYDSFTIDIKLSQTTSNKEIDNIYDQYNSDKDSFKSLKLIGQNDSGFEETIDFIGTLFTHCTNFDFTENSITNYDIIKKKLSDSLLIEQ